SCEFEEELSELLDKSHAVNPPCLLGPGVARTQSDVQQSPASAVGDESTGGRDVPVECPSQDRPTAAKRVRLDSTRAVVQGFFNHLREVEQNRQKRHEDRMAARRQAHVERLAALEKFAARFERQPPDVEPENE
ncbi:hypothetical protein V5799_029942, partial [Amblyomma americanum]